MNRLHAETSPYLLQHADNPVDWYPWGDEALQKAREEGKPILLSIGYSACHWCHVMAHESFEDAATAEVMNQHFVNIKVDREERPDLDKIYQTAHQLITRRNGGWPLTVFLTHDEQLPFLAGTYFPKAPLHGLPAFVDVLKQVAEYYSGNYSELQKQGQAVVHAFSQLEPPVADPAAELDARPLEALRQQLAENFDRDWGGFGDAPKFPHPTALEFLLRYWRSTAHTETPDVEALFMCALTVTRMADGGINDHLGGGFFRYSVDREWSIPHFEKMLYDNGPLLALLVQLWQASGDDTFRQAANMTADWAMREMQSPEGGFWSALDADSEGEEGRFYVWTPDAVAAALEPDENTVFAARYGLSGPPNFEGNWHLQVRETMEHAAETGSCAVSRAVALAESARTKLLAVRDQRPRPARDEKVLTSWNALMIRALAMAGRILGRTDLLESANRSLRFIRSQLMRDGQLLAVCTNGDARIPGYLDDHAFLLDGILELLQARWDSEELSLAIALAERLLEAFEDRERGGFYFTSNQHEQLVHRSRSFADDSLPSGNAIAARALGRLGHLLGRTDFLQAAERCIRAGQSAMIDFPHAHAALVAALDEYLAPPEIIVIRGAKSDIADWSANLGAIYAPRRLIVAIPDDAADLPDSLAQRASGPTARAYVCRGTHCSPAVESLEELARLVSEA